MNNLPGRGHDNNFNLIRLAAAVQVLVVHVCNHFEFGGWVPKVLKVVPGVPTFYFISGLLIFTAYDRMQRAERPGFYVNRFLRLYPGLWVCVALATLSVFASGYLADHAVSPLHFAAWVAGQSTIFQFYNPDFMRGYGAGVLNGALWTISIEVQFYLLVPALYAAWRRRPRLLAVVFALSLGVNLALRLALDWEQLVMKLIYVSFAPWLWMFLAGFWVAANPPARAFAAKLQLRYLLPAYILTMNLVGSYKINASNSINPVSFAILVLMILNVAERRLPVPAAVAGYVRRHDYSYGLYLYHMPVINCLLFAGWFAVGVNAVVAIAASFVLAFFSWHAIERVALSYKR